MKDSVILRELLNQYAEIAFSEKNRQAMHLCRAVNDLKPIRPTVQIGEVPWHEMNFDGFLTLQCKDSFWHPLEEMLRRTIFQHKYFPGDMMVTPYLPVGKVIHTTGIGVSVQEETLATDPKNAIVSHRYENQFQSMEDIEKLHEPVITYDRKTTMEHFERVSEVAADILPVKIVGEATGYGLGCITWDIISNYMTVDNTLFNLMDAPDFIHALVAKLTDIFVSTIKQYEKLNLLDPDALYIHCTPAVASDLENTPLDREKVEAKNVWGRGLAQILSTVSPEMHDEFDVQYMVGALEPFGLVYYGCCEPLDRKIDILRKIKNLRKISISPWADVSMAAEAMGKDYVASIKPNPAAVAVSSLDTDMVKKDTMRAIHACEKNGTPFEVILKDISTVGKNPGNLIEWHTVVMDTINRYYG